MGNCVSATQDVAQDLIRKGNEMTTHCESNSFNKKPPSTTTTTTTPTTNASTASKPSTTTKAKPAKTAKSANPVKPAKTKTNTNKNAKSNNKNIKNAKPPNPTTPLSLQDEYANADASKWKFSQERSSGSASYVSLGKQEELKGSIVKATAIFKANPGKYVAMTYQTSMTDWPEDQQVYTFIHRSGTEGYKPTGFSKTGWMTVLVHTYESLPPFKNNDFPMSHRDKYTDSMMHNRRKLHSKSNKPILPGRGMGCCDTPLVKIIGDVDPSDIHQGAVGDCWLLSGISSLAEFDGAVKRLFRKTPKLDQMPMDGPNNYIITLWDLASWKEVDIAIDERLCVTPDGKGTLLGARPSEDGELWVCYLEKALAAHCGGFDKITGGQCTHAWALLTGCKEQYTIRKNKKTGKYNCNAKFNPMENKWARHANSPHDADASVWQVAWPAVGGGGEADQEMTQEELFQKMCAWDLENYIVGAGITGPSGGPDKRRSDGMVDNHAYSVIECLNDVAGTDIDLIKVRNPWGKGEIEEGLFDDDGPGWDQYPQIKKKLNPVVADDGIFWVTKQEFFDLFQTVYLSASNMTEFLED